MKLIAALLGATFLLSPAADAEHRRYRHRHDHDHDRDYVTYREVRYARPPLHVRRHWHHDRVYTWGGRRYHWNDGAWVLYSGFGPRIVIRR